MDPLKVLDKLLKSTIQRPNTPSSQSETASSFENVLLEGSSIDANALHLAIMTLKERCFLPKKPIVILEEAKDDEETSGNDGDDVDDGED